MSLTFQKQLVISARWFTKTVRSDTRWLRAKAETSLERIPILADTNK